VIDVPFTEYRPPRGRRIRYAVKIPAALKDKYEDMAARGCRLTGERLSTGLISLAVEHDLGDVFLELCLPGQDPAAALHRLIERWDPDVFEAWLEDARKEG